MAITDNQKNALQVMEYGYPTLWAKIATGQQHDAISAKKEASRIISGILKVTFVEDGGLWPWKYWTKQSVCAQALYEAEGNLAAAQKVLTPSLGKIKALRFQRNVPGAPRADLSPAEQQDALRKQLIAVQADVMAKLGGDVKPEPETEKPEAKAEPEPEPIEVKPREPHPWLSFIRRSREFFAQRAADGTPLDEWGVRQAEYGAKMLAEGIPIEALKHAATMHLPPEARRSLNVREFDVMNFRPEDQIPGAHRAFPYILTVVKAGVPCAMIGPKGTGKTTLAQQVAQAMFGPDPTKFTLISMTSATSPSAFFGRPKIGGDGGVIESQWSMICRRGGLILLDELDAADENLMLIANSAVANRIFYNQQTGQMIHVHPDTVFMAAMNTMGLGGSREYVGRNKQDGSVLDRWGMGRVKIGLDEMVEDTIFYGILDASMN